jgi:hypothetical protein
MDADNVEQEAANGTTWGDAIGRFIVMVITALATVGLSWLIFTPAGYPSPLSQPIFLAGIWVAAVGVSWAMTLVRWMSPVFNRYWLDALFHLVLVAPAAAMAALTFL